MKRAAIALAVAFGIAAVLVGVEWTPGRSVESLKARWAPAPSRFVTIDGVSIHLRDEGPGTDPHPIVLIHGTASSLHTWAGWVAALRGQHRVVTFDFPGAGLSGPFPDDDYRMTHYTRFMEAFLDQLGVKHATLVGNSFGGRIAWETAVSRPDLANRLVLIDSTGYPDKAESPPIAFRLAKIPVFRWLIEHITPRSFVKKNLLEAYGDPRKVSSDLVDRYYELFLRDGNRRAFILQFEQDSDTDSDRIKTIPIPTLILWGGRDHVVPVADAGRFHQDIAHSRLVVFSRLGHVPQEEDPAQTVKAVENFLAGGSSHASDRSQSLGVGKE
jgi:pimeloyl-ACP methyl ester carboxylesterase